MDNYVLIQLIAFVRCGGTNCSMSVVNIHLLIQIRSRLSPGIGIAVHSIILGVTKSESIKALSYVI